MPVIDASVALKWFVDEPDSSSALTFRNGHIARQAPLIAPDLIAPTEDLAHRTIRMANHYKLTFYDALYVAVAQEVGVELVTADRHLLHRVSHLPFVHLLQ